MTIVLPPLTKKENSVSGARMDVQFALMKKSALAVMLDTSSILREFVSATIKSYITSVSVYLLALLVTFLIKHHSIVKNVTSHVLTA